MKTDGPARYDRSDLRSGTPADRDQLCSPDAADSTSSPPGTEGAATKDGQQESLSTA
jgi:hypothetical protein